jgi:hypothetical protein
MAGDGVRKEFMRVDRYLTTPGLVALLLWQLVADCNAARVYQIIDYPLLQEGHTLTGTITTTDDAPLDSLLQTDEILAWQWSIMGPRVRYGLPPGEDTFTATHLDLEDSSTVSTGVRISNRAIELPLATAESPEWAELLLGRSGPDARGADTRRLRWSTAYIDDERGQSNWYAAIVMFGDAGFGFWISMADSPGDPSWLLAKAIPEPSTFASGCLAALCLVQWRSRI